MYIVVLYFYFGDNILTNKKVQVMLALFYYMEAAPRFELGMTVLQTAALPLGYAAIFFCKGAVNRTGSVLPFAISFYSLLKEPLPVFIWPNGIRP